MTTLNEGEGTLTLGGQVFVIGPFTLGQFKRVRRLLVTMEAGGDDAEDAAAEIISIALLKRDPSMTTERVAELVLVPQLQAHVTAVLSIGTGASAAAGEATGQR